ncbi:MAG TPA: tetratricopeptide repeat protein [Puia sp.]|jgi:Tfp pilus assembly protein PilF
MKKVLFFTGLFLLGLSAFSQSADSLHKMARTYMWSGDYPNAIIVLSNALKQDPGNLDIEKDLAFTYYLQKNYSASVEAGRKLINRKDADEQCYQILGMAYKAIEEKKEADKMYRQGIKKFPNSGVLYNEYGEILWTKQDPEAIRLWEKGIEVDPSYPSNYYNACKYYYLTYDKIWTLIYGEIFINLESYSRRTPEIKSLLVDGYKKLFIDLKAPKSVNDKNPFVAACLSVMNDQSATVSLGISPEALGILRSKFILEWFDKYAGRFPFHLFDYERQLMKAGLFDAYNQWIFGASMGLASFQNWTAQHTDEYNRFINFQKGRVFKLPPGQNYRAVTAK